MSGKHNVNHFCWGVESPTKFSKKGAGDALQDHNSYMGVAGEDGGVIFQGGWWCSFYMKKN